jgi:hypothetical protein
VPKYSELFKQIIAETNYKDNTHLISYECKLLFSGNRKLMAAGLIKFLTKQYYTSTLLTLAVGVCDGDDVNKLAESYRVVQDMLIQFGMEICNIWNDKDLVNESKKHFIESFGTSANNSDKRVLTDNILDKFITYHKRYLRNNETMNIILFMTNGDWSLISDSKRYPSDDFEERVN